MKKFHPSHFAMASYFLMTVLLVSSVSMATASSREEADAWKAQCRARCASQHLPITPLVDGQIDDQKIKEVSVNRDDGCASNADCQMCWKTCSMLFRNFNVWGSMCRMPKRFCLPGCQTACRFKEVRLFESSTRRIFSDATASIVGVVDEYPRLKLSWRPSTIGDASVVYDLRLVDGHSSVSLTQTLDNSVDLDLSDETFTDVLERSNVIGSFSPPPRYAAPTFLLRAFSTSGAVFETRRRLHLPLRRRPSARRVAVAVDIRGSDDAVFAVVSFEQPATLRGRAAYRLHLQRIRGDVDPDFPTCPSNVDDAFLLELSPTRARVVKKTLHDLTFNSEFQLIVDVVRSTDFPPTTFDVARFVTDGCVNPDLTFTRCFTVQNDAAATGAFFEAWRPEVTRMTIGFGDESARVNLRWPEITPATPDEHVTYLVKWYGILTPDEMEARRKEANDATDEIYETETLLSRAEIRLATDSVFKVEIRAFVEESPIAFSEPVVVDTSKALVIVGGGIETASPTTLSEMDDDDDGDEDFEFYLVVVIGTAVGSFVFLIVVVSMLRRRSSSSGKSGVVSSGRINGIDIEEAPPTAFRPSVTAPLSSVARPNVKMPPPPLRLVSFPDSPLFQTPAASVFVFPSPDALPLRSSLRPDPLSFPPSPLCFPLPSVRTHFAFSPAPSSLPDDNDSNGVRIDACSSERIHPVRNNNNNRLTQLSGEEFDSRLPTRIIHSPSSFAGRGGASQAIAIEGGRGVPPHEEKEIRAASIDPDLEKGSSLPLTSTPLPTASFPNSPLPRPFNCPTLTSTTATLISGHWTNEEEPAAFLPTSRPLRGTISASSNKLFRPAAPLAVPRPSSRRFRLSSIRSSRRSAVSDADLAGTASSSRSSSRERLVDVEDGPDDVFDVSRASASPNRISTAVLDAGGVFVASPRAAVNETGSAPIWRRQLSAADLCREVREISSFRQEIFRLESTHV